MIHGKVAIEWQELKSNVQISISTGEVESIEIQKGKGSVDDGEFHPHTNESIRLLVAYKLNRENIDGAIMHVDKDESPFSFFITNVDVEIPIYAPELGVVVLTEYDTRSYGDIEKLIAGKGLNTNIEIWEKSPEESYLSAASKTKSQIAPTLLGVSRDFRVFNYDERTEGAATFSIKPTYSSHPMEFTDLNMNHVAYAFAYGRGISVASDLNRSLEEGWYPIRKSQMLDGEVEYESTAFVSLEKSPLVKENIRGTDYLVAAKYSAGSMLTPQQQEEFDGKKENELHREEETVLYHQVKATNLGSTPRYAWFKTIKPGTAWWVSLKYEFKSDSGFSIYPNKKVFAISKLDDEPLHKEEIAVLLQPGETRTLEFYLPHSPISNDRAKKLYEVDFDKKKDECLAFWKNSISQGASIHVPEERINNMINAGLVHLDLITYGIEPDATLAPTIGVYSPIGTESSPIIQFYASMGWLDIAKRSVNFFLDKQREDGFIQNFNGYMVETGAALYTMGEYYRYSNDTNWLKFRKDKILKSSQYLLEWRAKNKQDSLKGKGYGMISGKVADPDDHYFQYMLNGYGYLGLKRVAEMMQDIDSKKARKLAKEAALWKQDIRDAFFKTISLSPLVPLKDGTWIPSAAPWAGGLGMRSLNLKGENFWSHGTFMTADALLGPLYLVFCEVLQPEEKATKWLLDYHSDLLFKENTAPSQPYYSRHDFIEAKLGLTKPFLKMYYNSFSGLADRETLTFWEHVFEASHHKTHEEAWFLMQTRWMLYMEKDTETLELLKLIPRSWMDDGKKIILNDVQSYFGKLNVVAESSLDEGWIEASISGEFKDMPKTVTIRLPHPNHKLPKKVEGGVFDPENETVTIKNFSGSSSIKLSY
nr:hypothetical protein [uncultured Allomuricauda sp.]